MEISGKIAIITGASEGIGRATAKALAKAGASVALAARNAARLEELADEIRKENREALVVPTDVCDPAAVRRMVERTSEHFGRIDILVNNAGQSAAGRIAEIDIELFRRIMELNVYGAMLAMQTVVPRMRQAGGGVIVNVSSMVSKLKLPGLGTYAASKAALNLISATARVELAEEHIRVITVFPRTTETDFGKHALGDLEMRARQRAGASWRANVVVDSPEYVAGKILEAIQKEPEEMYMEG
jgi:short-subunit dehydrogenase